MHFDYYNDRVLKYNYVVNMHKLTLENIGDRAGERVVSSLLGVG